jgi:hypothetical protein
MKLEIAVCRYIRAHRAPLLEELTILGSDVAMDDRASVRLLTDDIRDAWYEVDIEGNPLRASMALFILLNNLLPVAGYCQEGSRLRGLLDVEGELEESRFQRLVRQRLEMDRRETFRVAGQERSGCVAVHVTSDFATYSRKVWVEELQDYDVCAVFAVPMDCSYSGKTVGDAVRTVATLREVAGSCFQAALERPHLWKAVTTGRLEGLLEARALAKGLFEGLSAEQIVLLTKHEKVITEAFKAAAAQYS